MNNSTQKILLCDDDEDLCELISTFLSGHNFSIETKHTFKEALECLEQNKSPEKTSEKPQEIFQIQKTYDLLVLDVMLPDKNGIEGLQEIRKTSQMPVIILSGKGEPVDRIQGLEFGADDYMSKPCDPKELLARIKAILRRPQNKNSNIIELPGLKINTSNREVKVFNKLVTLTGAEFNVLVELANNAGETIKKELLVEHALGRKMMKFERSIDMHVSNLRQKLGSHISIIGIRNHGYQLNIENK